MHSGLLLAGEENEFTRIDPFLPSLNEMNTGNFELIFDLKEIEATAKWMLKVSQNHNIMAFSGELGAGKTTFIAALCKALGVQEQVTSPTFSLIQEYGNLEGLPVYHIDLYRIQGEREALEAGMAEYLEGSYPCLVEWPENAPGIFPDSTVYATLTVVNENRRKLVCALPQ